MTIEPGLIFDLADGSSEWGIFLQQMNIHGYVTLVRKNWTTEMTRMPTLDKTIYRDISQHSDTAIVETSHSIVMIVLEHGEARVRAAAKTVRVAERTIEELQQTLIPEMPFEEGRRPVTFWTWGPYGPENTVRKLDVPSWESVQDNYEAQAELQDLMQFKPSTAGQLLLWRGKPGTGKTWALRALIWEWRDWANFHYVVDPEQFFGEHAAYLTRVLFNKDDDAPAAPGESRPDGESRWKILILEDCSEMISADARQRSGQGLSRLLNLVDGLIGQGLRVLVLITTNEELGALHEAVKRPGRCIADIEFKPIDAFRSASWLEHQGHDLSGIPAGSYTLAELYAILAGKKQEAESLVGFAR